MTDKKCDGATIGALRWHIREDFELEHDYLPARWRPNGRVSVFDRALGAWVHGTDAISTLGEAYRAALRLLDGLGDPAAANDTAPRFRGFFATRPAW